MPTVDDLEPPYWFREGLAVVLALATTMNTVSGLSVRLSGPQVEYVVLGVVLGLLVYLPVRWTVVTRAVRVMDAPSPATTDTADSLD